MIASVVKVPIAELQNSFQQYMKALKIKVTRDGRMVCGPRSPYRQTSTFALSAHVIEFMRRVPAKSTVTTRSMTTEERVDNDNNDDGDDKEESSTTTLWSVVCVVFQRNEQLASLQLLADSAPLNSHSLTSTLQFIQLRASNSKQ